MICDGTYARHQKSINNEYQRKSFSGQKKVPLSLLPFTYTTDGYVVDMLGPYLENHNDAEILKNIIPKVGIYFRIASFLNNTYGERLPPDVQAIDEILGRMHARPGLPDRTIIM